MGEVEVPALREVDLEVAESEHIVLLGPSGSGKSTLLHMLGGMDRPSAGTLAFRGRDLTHEDDRALTLFRREHVGFVFQFYNLVPSLTALENVEMAAEIASDPIDAREVLDLVGLADRADHFPAQLSGGEQQRVAIARAVVKAPDVLLCDEPTGALDASTGILVLEVLQHVNEKLGTALIVITHNEAIGDTADRVLRMGSGRIVHEARNETPRAPSEIRW
ncbi:MAG: ABC transporter ATP-binding protein [Planctomycetota bacterium]|nr:ABC transporter ATP-binding protein [Planctomycetota bacterium]